MVNLIYDTAILEISKNATAISSFEKCHCSIVVTFFEESADLQWHFSKNPQICNVIFQLQWHFSKSPKLQWCMSNEPPKNLDKGVNSSKINI